MAYYGVCGYYYVLYVCGYLCVMTWRLVMALLLFNGVCINVWLLLLYYYFIIFYFSFIIALFSSINISFVIALFFY